MTIGTKIMLQDITNFKATINLLKEQKTPFFTHDIHADKTVKFVLSGLHELPIEEIKTALSELEVNCLDIKPMRTKSSQQSLYLVYFAHKSVTLSQLKAIKAVLSVIIKWSPYTSSFKNGPTQCNNCQLYGHGNRNCHLPPRCLLCAGEHKKTECPYIQATNFSPLCCLCAGKHQSNHHSCPKRAEYVNMRQTSMGRYKTRVEHQQPIQSENPPKTKLQNLPSRQIATSIATPSHTQTSASQFPLQPPPTTFSSYARSQTSYADIVAAQPIDPANKDLFTADELMELTMALITDLSRCRTKIEQFQAVSNLAIKFEYSRSNVP